MLINNSETFLSEMSKLFSHNQTQGGSIYITMKRIDNSKKPKPRKDDKRKKSKKQQKQQQQQQQKSVSPAAGEHMCLIRVHNNNKKISIVVASKDVNKFQTAYSNLLRGNLYGLKKKSKKKISKSKAQ